MKKILLFFALPFFMISCFSEAFSGEEDAQCGDGTFVCRQDAEGRTDSYLCHYDEDFERENLNLFEAGFAECFLKQLLLAAQALCNVGVKS